MPGSKRTLILQDRDRQLLKGDDGLTGKPKPVCFGQVFNIPANMILAGELLISVHTDVDGNGAPIQAIEREGIPILPISRNIDKVTRAMDAAPLVQSGNVILMRNLDLLSDFLAEASVFPNGEHDDMIDAAMSAISDMSAPETTPAIRAL